MLLYVENVIHGSKLPDAIHIATAQAANCKTLITNDKRLKTDNNMQVLLLSDLKSRDLVI